jgi:hypothetical protein
MIANVIQILTAAGQNLTQQIKENTPKVTGETARSLGYEVSAENNTVTLTISAKKFFKVVETGRGPTKGGASSEGPSLVENIKKWLRAKGESNLGMAYGIAKRIHEKGTLLYQQGGRQDVFSNVLTDRNIQKIEKSVLDAMAEYYLNEFITNLKQNKLIKDVGIST